MAVAKSTIILAPGGESTTAVMVGWSSLATGANNTYFDVNGVDASKAVLLVASLNATAMTATSTGAQFWIGASNSAASGASGEYTYSARRLARMKVSVYSSNGGAAIFNLSPSTAAGKISIGVLGPFIWTGGKAQFWLAVPTSMFAMVLLPIAYFTFYLLMNQKSLLGNNMPHGLKRLAWNILMAIAAGLASFGCVWTLWSKFRWLGISLIVAFVALALLVHFIRSARQRL